MIAAPQGVMAVEISREDDAGGSPVVLQRGHDGVLDSYERRLRRCVIARVQRD